MLSELPFMPVKNATVFLRADLNVPLKNDQIEDDFRLKALQPTLDLLIAEHARIIIGTHIGRPHGYDSSVSTRHLLSWFRNHDYNISFASTLHEAHEKIKDLKPGSLLLLENLRFLKGEKECDEALAHELKSLAEFYVNDAFGLLHRKDTSISLLPCLYSRTKKTIGLLIEKELFVLEHLKKDMRRPFLVFLGGSKIKDKLPVIEALLSHANTIAICPALSFTFLKAQGYLIGKSLVEDTVIPQALTILHKARAMGIKLLFPVDYLISLQSLKGELKVVSAHDIPSDGIGLTVGPKTLDLFKGEIEKAGTIFLNGSMGLQEQPQSLQSFQILLQTIAQSQAYSVIGGGESVAAVYYYGLNGDISFCSSGGGSTLVYISNESLPGLQALLT